MSSTTNEALSRNEQQQHKRLSAEKPVTTKDIANLYSSLQTMIENVPKSPRLDVDGTQSNGSNNSNSNNNSDQWHPSFPLTPTTSSNILLNNKSVPTSPTSVPSRRTATPKEPDCPCHHILVSKDSKYCALCDDVIPILSELHQDREKKREEIKEYKNSLSLEKDKSREFEKNVNTLKKKSEELTEKLNATNQQYTSLQKDMQVLQQKLEQEKVDAEQAKKAKADLELELEDLSQKLFEEANGMVANEKREKYQIEIQYKHLQEELKSCREQLEAEELQLKELKLKMGDMEEQHQRDSRLGISSLNGSGLFSEGQSSVGNEDDNDADKRASKDLAGLFIHEEESTISSTTENETDPLIMNEFKEFVDAGETIPIRKLHTISFMKNSLIEDVEPCLRFGPNSRLSAKKMYEAIALNTCFIEEAPYGFAQEQAKRPYDVPLRISAAKSMIWERLSSAPIAPFAGCQACGRNPATKTQLTYRFRISMLDDWACIDRYCRDRLVAVCEFYSFVRNVRQGYYNGRTIPDLYNESTRLKLQMFYAR